LKNKELIQLMQSDFDSGESLPNIFEKYKNNNVKEKRLAYFVASLKDKSLIEKYKNANKVLVGIMVVLTIFTAFTGYAIGSEVTPESALYWTAIAIIPALFVYGFIKINYQAYLVYILLCISQFHKNFVGFGTDMAADIIGLIISISILALVWFLKSKLFPYMGFIGPKKNQDKRYLVEVNSFQAEL